MFTVIAAVIIALGAEPRLELVQDPSFNPGLLLIYTILTIVLAPVPGIIVSATIKSDDLRDAHGRTRILKRVRIASLLYQGYLLGSFVLVTYVFDWPLIIEGVLGMHGWVLIDELLRLAPFLAMLVLAWVPLYRIDRVLRQGHWTMHEYMEFHFRQYVLFVLMPFVVMVTVVDVMELLPGCEMLRRTGLSWIVALGAMGTLYVVSPLALRHIWRTRRMEDGPLRRRLEALSGRAVMGYRDLLVWETMGGYIVNACVAGILAPVRYVMVTDALVDTLSAEEVEGVFAHEIGHIKLHHMVYYVLFVVVSVAAMVLVTALPFFPQGTDNGGGLLSVESAVLAVLGILFWGVAFGVLSRRMELEADVYAVGLTGSTSDFVNALERISFFSGRPRSAGSWRHFSIARRTGFLEACQADPARCGRFLAAMHVLRWVLVALSVVGVAAAAYVIFAL